ncbi:hypothetical protein H5T58_03355, partial [Candidatus Parcubacteria bacterium]|nr:hypothetical protein [Candidatus Parcubacteria bacterium]
MALELVILILLLVFLYFVFKLSEKIGQQTQINLQQAKDIEEIKKVLFLGSQIQDHLKNGLEKTRDLLEEL